MKHQWNPTDLGRLVESYDKANGKVSLVFGLPLIDIVGLVGEQQAVMRGMILGLADIGLHDTAAMVEKSAAEACERVGCVHVPAITPSATGATPQRPSGDGPEGVGGSRV